MLTKPIKMSIICFHLHGVARLDVQTNVSYTLRNKGTKVFTGAVPFQKVHVCT